MQELGVNLLLIILKKLINKDMANKINRHTKVQDIFKHAEVLNSNRSTLVFLLATMNDKELTKFHKEYLSIVPKTKDRNFGHKFIN